MPAGGVAPDILQAAIDTYDLARAAGLDTGALSQAIGGALVEHERQVIERAADAAEELAVQLDQDEQSKNTWVSGAVALHWFAARLRKDLPPLASPVRYLPNADDVVEVVLTGRVAVHLPRPCRNCGEPGCESESWSLLDRSGAEYHFLTDETEGLRVRVLKSGTKGEHSV